MFIVKLYSLLDIFAAALLFLSLVDFSPLRLFIGLSLYLIIKGYLYFGDVFSFFDLLTGSYMLLSLLLPVVFLSFFFGSVLAAKGVYSFFSV